MYPQKPLPSQDRLNELFSYNENTGVLLRKISISSRAIAGTVAGSFNKSRGYRHIGVDGTEYSAHRLIWKMVYGYDPAEQIDHENHNRADNRIDNLCEASNTKNSRNIKRPCNNTSGVVGIWWSKPNKNWVAEIKINQRKKHLGCFADKADAIAARKEAEIKYGFHPNHGGE